MIIGIGCDVVQIPRIARLLDKFGNNFVRRICTDREISALPNTDNCQIVASFYAKRFAAKEACVKALGTGFTHGITFKDVEVVANDAGKPTISINKKGMPDYKLHLSLSDDYPIAQAMVIIESL
jgi:holo-[acyl-carrier protein] synthase